MYIYIYIYIYIYFYIYFYIYIYIYIYLYTSIYSGIYTYSIHTQYVTTHFPQFVDLMIHGCLIPRHGFQAAQKLGALEWRLC